MNDGTPLLSLLMCCQRVLCKLVYNLECVKTFVGRCKHEGSKEPSLAKINDGRQSAKRLTAMQLSSLVARTGKQVRRLLKYTRVPRKRVTTMVSSYDGSQIVERANQ